MTTASAPKSAKMSPIKAAKMRIGSDLNSKWHIDKLLGVGGMGAVFAVTHKNNGSRAAAKVLHAEFSQTDDIRIRFLREGKIANRVDHPGRVPVFDDDLSDRGEPFLLMDLLIGGTMADLMRKGGRGGVPLERLLKIMDPVLDLLGKCHEVGIVHRDIKPANIFLSEEGHVKVLDFGVARMREPDAEVQATRVGIALGTASFIAPEQALGAAQLDGRADLFSVAACLYQALAGKRLHAAKTEAEEFVKAATQPAPSISIEVPDLPAQLVAFIDRALSYDKSQRFQTAQEMRTELLTLIENIKSGLIQRGDQKKTAGVVVRGNELIEDGGELSDREQKEALQKMQNVFKFIGLAMANVRQYGFLHPQTARTTQHAFAEIASALANNAASVRWEVTAGAFVFDGVPVWEPERVPFDRIPHQLFADGIRKVQFKPGLTEQELSDFIAILMRDISNVFSAEDDSVTALWDRRFDHIAYLAVDSWAEGSEDTDDEAREAEWDELADQVLTFARIDKDFDDVSLEAQAAGINIATSLREAGEAAAAHALDPMTKASLGAQVNVPFHRWQDAYVETLVPAYVEGKKSGDIQLLFGALKEWTDDQVALHASEQAFEMHQAMAAAFTTQIDEAAGRAVELETAALMFPIETLKSIMADFASDRRGADESALPVNPQVVVGLGRALELLAGDSVYALACECLDAGRSAELRDVLVPYLDKWSSGKEATLGAILPRANEEMAFEFIELLAKSGTPAAMRALESAFGSNHLSVRLAALAKLGEGPGERIRAELSRMLGDDDVAVRSKVLKLIVELSVVTAGPILASKIRSDEYHGLAVEERRAWLEAVHGLFPARGEALAIELINQRRILTSDATDKTRALAAEFLGQADSDDAYQALEETSKQRWRTNASVREAAKRAIDEIDARRLRGATTGGKA